jgi:hypothetical protein
MRQRRRSFNLISNTTGFEPRSFINLTFVGKIIRAHETFEENRFDEKAHAHPTCERASFKMSYAGKEDSLAQKEC